MKLSLMTPSREGGRVPECGVNDSVDSVGQSITEVDCSGLVHLIRAGDQRAMEEFYRRFRPGMKLLLYRQLGPQDIEDQVQDAVCITVEAIQRDEIREPSSLKAFIVGVVRHKIRRRIQELSIERQTVVGVEGADTEHITSSADSPEWLAIKGQRLSIIRDMLEQMEPDERAVLTRFYVDEQSADEICADLNMSSNTFRCLKSRAKQKFADLTRRKMVQRAFGRFAISTTEAQRIA